MTETSTDSPASLSLGFVLIAILTVGGAFGLGVLLALVFVGFQVTLDLLDALTVVGVV